MNGNLVSRLVLSIFIPPNSPRILSPILLLRQRCAVNLTRWGWEGSGYLRYDFLRFAAPTAQDSRLRAAIGSAHALAEHCRSQPCGHRPRIIFRLRGGPGQRLANA